MLHTTWSKNPVMSNYFMHYQKLKSVDAVKYLGVSISKDLSWNTHISSITTCANKTLGFVNQTTNGPVNVHLLSWPSEAQNIQNLENIR